MFSWMNSSNQKGRNNAKFKHFHILEKTRPLYFVASISVIPNPENEIINKENDRAVSVLKI